MLIHARPHACAGVTTAIKIGDPNATGIGITFPSTSDNAGPGHTANVCVNAITAPVSLSFDPAAGTHNYTVVWGTNSVTFVIDGEAAHTVAKTAPQDVMPMTGGSQCALHVTPLFHITCCSHRNINCSCSPSQFILLVVHHI